MTIDWRKYWWQPGCTAAFFAIGVPYWQIPYHKVNLPGALLGAGLVVLFAVTVLTRLYSGKSFMRVTMVLGAVAPAVVLARVMFEVARDPATHNLWPFEVIIAIVVGGMVALAGALLGSMVLRISRSRRGEGE
jgi:hypothetical protein